MSLMQARGICASATPAEACAHSSDVAMMVLTPAEWATLESEATPRGVAARFLALDADFDEFMKQAYPVPRPKMASLAQDMIDWEGGPTYRPSQLQYIVVLDGPGRPRTAALRVLIDEYVKSAMVDWRIHWSTHKESTDRNDIVQKVAPHVGVKQIRLMNSQLTAFVVVESNGVAAGWSTVELSPATGAKRPWWQFW